MALGLILRAPGARASVRASVRSEVSFDSLRTAPFEGPEARSLARDPLALRVDLDAAEIAGGQPFRISTSLRLESDLGWQEGEPELLDGAERRRAELMQLSLRWIPPRAGFSLEVGRLLELGAVQARYYDGGRVDLRHGPWRAGLFAGQTVKAGSLWALPTFEPDGVRSSDAALTRRVEGTRWPFVLTPEHDAPSILAGVRAGVVSLRTGRLQASFEEARSAGVVDRRLVTVRGWAHRSGAMLTLDLAYDLLQADLQTLDATLGWGGLGLGRLTLLFERWRPTFDGDSIWNLFVLGPRQSAGLRWRASRRWPVGLSFDLRRVWFLDPVEAVADGAWELRLHLRRRSRRLTLFASGQVELGHGGNTGWVVAGGRARFGEAIVAQARLVGGYLGTGTRRAGLLLGSRTEVAYRFAPASQVRLALEVNRSALAPLDLRVLASLEVGLGAFFGGGRP